MQGDWSSDPAGHHGKPERYARTLTTHLSPREQRVFFSFFDSLSLRSNLIPAVADGVRLPVSVSDGDEPLPSSQFSEVFGFRLWSNRHVLETPEEINRLQRLLDRSAAGAGAHLRDIISDDHRLSAVQVSERLQGMRLLVVATVTADGRPLAGPVDSYLLHGSFYFSSGRNSVRMRHLAARPVVSATHLVGEELAVTVHGRAELFELADPARGELRRAMLDYYLPLQGPAFETWLDEADPVAARIEAEKMFVYSTND